MRSNRAWCMVAPYVFCHILSYIIIKNSAKPLEIIILMYYNMAWRAGERFFSSRFILHTDMRVPGPERQGAVNHVRRGTEQH